MCMGVDTGKGLEGRKYDAVESNGGVFYEYGNTAGEGGESLRIDLRECVCWLDYELVYRITWQIYPQTEPMRVSQIKK